MANQAPNKGTLIWLSPMVDGRDDDDDGSCLVDEWLLTVAQYKSVSRRLRDICSVEVEAREQRRRARPACWRRTAMM